MNRHPTKVSFLKYLKNLVSNSSDLFSIITVVLFAISVAANWVNVDNENIKKLINITSYFPTPILFFLILRSGYNLWKLEVSQIVLPKFTIVPLESSFQLTNPGTVHPDSQCNIFFNLNISNSSSLGSTIKSIEIEHKDIFNKYFSELIRTRVVDLQNNHKELIFPIRIPSGASEDFHIEFGYAPMNIRKEDVQYPNIPSHILDFASKIKEAIDYQAEVKIKYISDGQMHAKKIDLTISFSLYKDHFLKKWKEYGWDKAAQILNK